MGTHPELEESHKLAEKLFGLLTGLARSRAPTVDAENLAATIVCRLVRPANLGKLIKWKSLIEARQLPRRLKREVFSRVDRLIRRQRREMPLPVEEAAPNADPGEDLSKDEFIDALPAHLRRVFHLMEEGWRQSEIGDKIGRTERTVHHWVADLRARAKLWGYSPTSQ